MASRRQIGERRLSVDWSSGGWRNHGWEKSEQPSERDADHAAVRIQESRLINQWCGITLIANMFMGIEQIAERQRDARAARPPLTYEPLLQIGEKSQVEG